MALGITPLSWAQWLARALDQPFSSYAVNGATTADVLQLQLPRVLGRTRRGALRRRQRRPLAGVRLGRLRARPRAVAAGLAARADRLLVLTMPEDLGRPTSAPKPALANDVVRRVAARHGAAVADLADFGGWTLVCRTPCTRRRSASSRSPTARRARSARRCCLRRSSPTAAVTTCAMRRRMRGRSRATSCGGLASAWRRAERHP